MSTPEWLFLEGWREVRYRADLTRHALRHRCRFEGDWCLSRRERYWLTAKCILAVWLGLDERAELENRVEVAAMNFARTSSMEFGAGAEWDSLNTRKRGLGYEVSTDGYP
jgi:hypothetical protein